MVNYNVPGVKKPLNLNGKVLAKIYAGKITNWNDPAIKALNPGRQPAEHEDHRRCTAADSSGSTFLFTSYLNAQDPADWPIAARRHHGDLAERAPAARPRPAAAAW